MVGTADNFMKTYRRRTMIPACGLAFLMLIVIAIPGPARADPNEALVNAVASAFTPGQISQLIASAAGDQGSRTDQETRSLDRLRQMLNVSGDAVLALLRILDRPDIRPAESTQALAQSAVQYHAVTDRLSEITSDDPEGQSLLTQAQAAMIAGHFNDTETLLRQLEDREVTFSNRSPSGVVGPTSSAAQHLISAAQAGTALGEIALMKSRYGEATIYFQAAQQRLALLSHGDVEPPEPQPGVLGPSAVVDTALAIDTPSSVEIKLPPQPKIGSVQVALVQPSFPRIDAVKLDESPQQKPAAIGLSTTVANQLAAVTTNAPLIMSEQPTGSPAAGPALSADMLTLLLRRGDALLALGDVSAARLLYERAAAGGDGRGATGAGKTYDPAFLLAMGARGIQADPVAATSWYRKAIELGDRSAAMRLTQMSQRTAR
jgi:TPR repeat protein